MSIIFLLETHAGFVSFNHFSPELGAGKHFPQKVGVISLYHQNLVLLAQKSGLNQIIYVFFGGNE
jgi:hypothetical protein